MAKKIFAALMMFAVMLTSSVASAVFEENVEEGANLAAVQKIAIAMPNFYKVADTEPELQDLIKGVYEAGKRSSTLEIVSYEDVAAAIRRDTGVDILSLDVVEADKVYKKNIARYADAYVVETVTNNSDLPQLFFYVYKSSDSNLMYTYNVRSRLYRKRTEDYERMADEFFIQFDTATLNTLEGDAHKQLQKRQKEIREQKRKMNRAYAKTKRNKVNMVRKK